MLTSNNIIKKFSIKNLHLAINIAIWTLLLITIVAVFVPFSPSMPVDGLDPSWVFGMNQAMAQGLSFGKELIFTFGPYAAIYTKAYHPATDFMMVSGSLYLALSYWACFVLLMKDVQWRWAFTLCTVFAGLMYSRDTLFFSQPLLVGLVIFKLQSVQDEWLVKNKIAIFYMALLFAPLGLLPLVKGSLLILCVAVAILCAALFIAKRHRFLAITCLLSPIFSMLFFWLLSGQAVVNLPGYFISMAPIVSGYTEAMATNALEGNVYEVVLYLIASAFMLLAISLQGQITRPSKLFLVSIYFIFLFLSFKHGFVRHDGHALTSSVSILIAALLLPLIFNSEIILSVIGFALLSWLSIDRNYFKTSTETVGWNVESTYSSMWHGINNRINNRNWLKSKFDAKVNSIREKASFPILSGTTDIYSYNQAYLIASGNTWLPRPILQSYSVYTPELAEINRKHLLGNQAPDNIIFNVEPIDGRIPSIEDGASWPILILNYRPTQMANDFLFLQKKANISDIEESFKLTSEKHTFGENVNIPESNQPIFVQIEIKPTVLGRIANILFKPSQLQITLALKNGLKKQFRIIAGMAKSGFVLSPLIENTTEFEMLYSKSDFLDKKQVKSFVIEPRYGKTMLWNNDYSITISQIKTNALFNISKEPAK